MDTVLLEKVCHALLKIGSLDNTVPEFYSNWFSNHSIIMSHYNMPHKYGKSTCKKEKKISQNQKDLVIFRNCF